MTRVHSGRSQFGLRALALAGAMALGAIAVSLLPLPLPKSLQNSPLPQEIAISSHAFDDERPVEVTVSRSSSSPVAAPVPGVLSSYDCTVGAQVESGTSFFALDGAPVLALATEVPLWRDLAVGDTGADVRSLQAELKRLGYDITVDGSIGRETLKAGSQSLAAVGIHWREPTFPVSRTIWMPAQRVSVGTCDSTLGARVAGGDSIATFSSGYQTLTVDDLPTDLIPGPRVVTIGTNAIPVDTAGRSGPVPFHVDVQAPDSATGEDSASKPIAAVLALAEPTTVSSVPPAAIVALDGSQGCVESSGRMLHVHVVGSQLGQTFVQFDTGESPHHIQLHPSRRRCP